MLTGMISVLHAHAAPPATCLWCSRRHRGKQWVSYSDGGEGIVHQDVFQFGSHFCRNAVSAGRLSHIAEVVTEGDGAVSEVESGSARQVCVVRHDVLVAVVQHRLLFDDPVDHIRGAKACRWNKGQSMCPSLHLKFLWRRIRDKLKQKSESKICYLMLMCCDFVSFCCIQTISSHFQQQQALAPWIILPCRFSPQFQSLEEVGDTTPHMSFTLLRTYTRVKTQHPAEQTRIPPQASSQTSVTVGESGISQVRKACRSWKRDESTLCSF